MLLVALVNVVSLDTHYLGSLFLADNLHKLKSLVYLNLALNNLSKVLVC